MSEGLAYSNTLVPVVSIVESESVARTSSVTSFNVFESV